MMMRVCLTVSLAAALACGGGQSTDSKGQNLGESNKGDDLDVPNDGTTATGGGDSGQGDGGDTGEGGADAKPDEPAAPVTIVIKNTWKEDLVFSTDKGWQPIVFGFSGKPPKAKPIIMFPKFCTASCEAPAEERCPFCKEPEKVKEIRKAEKREIVPPGKTFEIPWDAMVYEYKRTKGKRDGRTKRCECHQKKEVPPETYTIRVCGLRVTKTANQRSKIQCVDGQMTVPSEEPIRVELEFGKPK
jgi:hypothetical protein